MSGGDPASKVREVLVACGGWNARSRAILRVWAASHGVDAARLRSLVVAAAGRPARGPVSTPVPAPVAARRVGRPWLAAAGAAFGLCVSLLMGVRLMERWPGPEAPRRPAKPAPTLPGVSEAPDRTLPPTPVPFPTSPDMRATPTETGEAVAFRCGPRPSGEATEADVQAFARSLRSILRSWPEGDPADASDWIDELAGWIAGSASVAELERFQGVLRKATDAPSDPERRMLAQAFTATLLDRVRRSDSLTSVAAERLAAGSEGAASDPSATWAVARLAELQPMLRSADGRGPWAAWIRVVSAMPAGASRDSVVLRGLESLLRSGARLDGQGLPADVAGALLRRLTPVAASREVRTCMASWLRDASIDSRSLWALGGVWRTLPEAPDPDILPAERDTPRQRQRLAEVWTGMASRKPGIDWSDVDRRLAAATQAPPSDLAASVRQATALVQVLEGVRAVLAGGSLPAEPGARTTVADGLEPAAPDDRWSERLADPLPARRLLGLDGIRTAAPVELGWLDARLVVGMATGSRSGQERERAIELLRGPLASTPTVRRALLMHLPDATDLRRLVEPLEVACGRPLASAKSDRMRLQSIVALLSLEASQDMDPSCHAAVRDLGRACERLAASRGTPPPGSDPAATMWALAEHRGRQVQAVTLPESFAREVGELADRARRLRELRHSGPGGFAAACMSLMAWQAAWLAAERPEQADQLASMLRAARVEASGMSEAMPQACVALASIARMEMACHGGVLPVGGSVTKIPGEAGTLAAAARAQGAERARLLARAFVDGDGAMLPRPNELDPEAGISLIRALASCQASVGARLESASPDDPGRRSVEAMAEAGGRDLRGWCAMLSRLSESERWRMLAPLRLEALRRLDADPDGWARIGDAPACPVP